MGQAKKDGYNRTFAIQGIRERISVNIRRTPHSPTPLESSLNSLFNHVLIILKRPLEKVIAQTVGSRLKQLYG